MSLADIISILKISIRLAIFIITIHIEIVIFPYFEKKKQIGFERTINSSLSSKGGAVTDG